MYLNTRIKWAKVPTVPIYSTGSATIAPMLQLFAPATQTELPSLEIHLQRVKSIRKFILVQSNWGKNILYLLHQNQKIIYLHCVACLCTVWPVYAWTVFIPWDHGEKNRNFWPPPPHLVLVVIEWPLTELPLHKGRENWLPNEAIFATVSDRALIFPTPLLSQLQGWPECQKSIFFYK